MKRFIHILTFLAVALFVLSTASPANADGTDPSIIILNNGDQVLIPGTSFSFFTDGGTGFQDCNFTSPAPFTGCNFQNTNPGGATWTALDIDISQVIDQSSVTCNGGVFFTSCVVTNDVPDGTIDISLSGGPGITPLDFPAFSIAGWAPGTVFDGTITLSTPEPGSLALLLAGGGLFLAWRRRQTVSHT